MLEVRRYRSEVESHRHDFHQVVLPLEGRLRMTVGGVAGAVSSECAALVAAGEIHSFTGSKSNAFLVVDIPVDSPVVTDAVGTVLWERVRDAFGRTRARRRR